MYVTVTVPALQMNYEYLCRCVEGAPVPLMPATAWEGILDRVGPHALPAPLPFPLSSPLLLALHQEVQSHYEDTIRKSSVRMTLNRPATIGLAPEPPIPANPL